MNRDRDLLLNFERMWREIDELVGDPWPEAGWTRAGREQVAFSPRVDVYYANPDHPRAIVTAELAGIDIATVSLEVSGRDLVISGERAMQESAGRAYQQVEIEAGRFRRVIKLSADVAADQARATYEDGMLRVELPLQLRGSATRRVPITSPDDEG